MDQYIKELLLLHSKIILPQFGAIVIANEETGELSFNEYLNYDDGKLSALLESESNMDLQEAQNRVAKFVRDLKLQLNKGETYSIFQLGEFRKDDDGSFIFEGNIKTGGISGSDTTSGPSPTPTVVATPLVEEETPKEKEKEVEKVAEKEVDKENDAITPEKVETKDPIIKAAVIPESSPKVKAEESIEGKKNIYIEKKSGDTSTTKSTDSPEPKVAVVEKKKRKGFVFWAILILLILFISGGTFVLMNEDKVDEYMGWKMFEKKKTDSDQMVKDPTTETKTETTREPKEEVIPEKGTIPKEEVESIPKETTAKTPVKEEKKPIVSSSGQHHIVVGCFEDKTNADQMVERYKEKGFDSKIISHSGGLYFVAAQSYPTSKAAFSDLPRVRQTTPSAWLFKQ